jgi:hypothetical protein
MKNQTTIFGVILITLTFLISCGNNQSIIGTYENSNHNCRIYLYPNGKFMWVNGDAEISNPEFENPSLKYKFNTNNPHEIGTYELTNENGVQIINVKVKVFYGSYSIDDRHRFKISGSTLLEKGGSIGSWVTFNKIDIEPPN